MSHYQFNHEPLFARLKPSDPEAAALLHATRVEGRTLNVSENSSDAAPGIIFPTLGNYLSKCRDCKHNGGDEDRTCTGEKGNHVADLRTAR